MKLRITKQAGFVLAVAGAAIVGGAATAIVQAAIPSTVDGQIHACYRNNASLTDAKGALRVINSQATPAQTCTAQETALGWNQMGPSSSDNLPPLTGADLSGFNMNLRDFKGVNLTGTVLEGASLRYSNFNSANFTNAQLGFIADHSDFTSAVFTGANMQTGITANFTNFTNANISNQTVSSASFKQAVFSGTNFSGTSFASVDFTGSDMSTANLSGVTWSSNTTCPDGSSSGSNGDTCIGHLTP